MKIRSLDDFIGKPSFKKALSKEATVLMDDICTDAEQVLHKDKNSTMFDFFSYAAYSLAKNDIGVGTLNSLEAQKFLLYMKPYVGFSRVKDYPLGRLLRHDESRFYCPYDRSSITIGEDTVDFSKLLNEDYGCLLTRKDLDDFVIPNSINRKSINRINYENVLGTSKNYPILRLFRKAWDSFNEHHYSFFDPLRIEFEDFKHSPVAENFDRVALYPFIARKEPDLFKNFDISPKRQKKFEKYKEKYKDEIEFFTFRQFIAYKQRIETKKALNEKGIEVDGDVPIGFGPDEIWAFPDAFDKVHTIGWGFPLLKYYDLIKNPNSAAAKLLRQKFGLAARIYDGIRVDVGVSYDAYMVRMAKGKDLKESYLYKEYTTPLFMRQKGYSKMYYKSYDNKGKVLDFIEKTIRDIKGDDYDFRKITYEADGNSGKVLNWDAKPYPKDVFKNRNAMFTTYYEYPKHGNNYGWGSVDFFLNTAGMNPDSLTIGTNNHDGIPLRMVAEEKKDFDMIKNREKSTFVLSKTLNIPRYELKDAKKWIKAKFAELYFAPRRFLYYIDVLGKKDRINNEDERFYANRFRARLNWDFERQYHASLQEGQGFNRPEILSMVFKAKGLDKVYGDLYKKLEFLSGYLGASGALSEKEAEQEVVKKGYDEAIEGIRKIDSFC